MGLKVEGKIEKINGKEVSCKSFTEIFLKENKPVVATNLMDAWRACQDWVNKNGEPNLHFFSIHFGKSKVQNSDKEPARGKVIPWCFFGNETDIGRLVDVFMYCAHGKYLLVGHGGDEKECMRLDTQCKNILSSCTGLLKCEAADCCTREFTDQKRLEMSVSQFIDHWLGLSAKNHGNSLTCSDVSQSLLYLKDWHFVKEYPEYVAYTTPHYFADDWLNLYLDSYSMNQVACSNHNANEINCSDYRFVYMGAKGTWTPLHADVFRSYSWSANICGRKVWYFLPPSQCHLIFDRNLKTSVYDVHSNVSETAFPGFKQAVWLECTQERNEIIFVPSGWYHQVHNLEDTISINHNWFNGYNLSWVWNLLVKDYEEAKEYIEDIRDICDDFEGLCQRNLAANTGMNYYDFFRFITRFTLANLTILQSLNCNENSSKAHNIIANIESIREVASKMVSAEAFSEEIIKRCYEIMEHTKEEESNFLKFCTAISMSYETTEEEQEPYCKERKNTTTLSNGKLEIDILHKYAISCPLELCTVIDEAISEHRFRCKDCELCMQFDSCNDETLGFERVVL